MNWNTLLPQISAEIQKGYLRTIPRKIPITYIESKTNVAVYRSEYFNGKEIWFTNDKPVAERPF